jgi:transposase InsO family protein
MEPSKDQALKNFKLYKLFLETQTGEKIKRFCTDNGSEYIRLPFKEFCTNEGIIMEMMAPYSLAQNGIAECCSSLLCGLTPFNVYIQLSKKFRIFNDTPIARFL